MHSVLFPQVLKPNTFIACETSPCAPLSPLPLW